MKCIILCLGLFFGLITGVNAQCGHTTEISGKSVAIYFRFDKAVVDSGYMDNHRALLSLDILLSDSIQSERIDSINIFSFSSPDGSRKYNQRLSERRSAAIKKYLLWKYPHLDHCSIYSRPQGENWQGLRQLIEQDTDQPSREKVLQIIDHTPDTDLCKVLLRRLDGGIPYHYIRNRLLRNLRSASVCIVWMRQEPLVTLPGPVYSLSSLTQHSSTPILTEHLIPDTIKCSIPSVVSKRPLLAIKTNLLFDATLMPNVEIEVPIGKRWSINGEYMFPWWLIDNDKYCLQIVSGGLEGRYWLGNRQSREQREVLTGHFLGLYAGGGKYDLQWKENGYQGEFFIAAGISYGWATRIARNLHLELNVGIGMLRTNYRHYHAIDDYETLLWQKNGRYTWFGPTKAKLSLVWLLNRNMKKRR